MHDGNRCPSEGPERGARVAAPRLGAPMPVISHLLITLSFGVVKGHKEGTGAHNDWIAENVIIVKGISRNFHCIKRTAKLKLSHFYAVLFSVWKKKNLLLYRCCSLLLHFVYQKFENTGVCFWPLPLVSQFGSFLVVYCRIEEISRVNVSCAGPHKGTHATSHGVPKC